jgi:O-antigen/teichoic acid export membrane protein
VNRYISKYYWLVISSVYWHVFHEKMSNETKSFFINLSYVGLGASIYILFTFAFNTLCGRFLGPTEYGEFNLVQSIAMFLYIPMLMGSHVSMVKYNSEKKEFRRQQEIISTTYILVFVQLLITVFLYRVFEQELMKIFSISNTYFNLSVIFAILFVFYTLTTETLRSLHEMKIYSILQPIFSIILLFSFLAVLYLNIMSLRSLLYSMYLAYGIAGLISLLFIYKYLKIYFDKEWIITLTKYSSYAVIGGFSFVLYSNIVSILINKYMQVEYVGIYKVYFYSFTINIPLLMGMFTTVFFPYASMCENKKSLLNKVNKSIFYLIAIGLPCSIISGLIIFKIYGDAYTLDPKLVLLFGISGICISIEGLYKQLMNSIGIKGIKIVTFADVMMALINVLFNLLLIPKIGIEGAAIATISSYCIAIIIIFSKRKYIYDFST